MGPYVREIVGVFCMLSRKALFHPLAALTVEWSADVCWGLLCQVETTPGDASSSAADPAASAPKDLPRGQGDIARNW